MMKQPVNLQLSKEAWIFIILTIISAIVLFKYVNLVPRVDNNFFFSDTDPQFQDENSISHQFKRKDTLLIINAAGNIESEMYMQRIQKLSDALLKLRGIVEVKSITNGPNGVKNALKGPLWKRLLISKDQASTNIVVFLKDSFSRETIPAIEKLIPEFSSSDFHLIMSGPPYIVELVSRHLLKDIRVFSLLVLIIFGAVILLIFRSSGILLGSMISCISASMWTLMIVHTLDIKIGLLTANLATIVFVLTLSHIIFLTYNWKYVYSQSPDKNPVEEAIHLTFSPSFWSMLTTLLGFFSLLFVPAQPLKELGASGVTGALVAISVAYSVYPAFLRLVEPSASKNNSLDRYQTKVEQFLEKRKKSTVIAIFSLFILALPGLWMANTDPSLLSFFTKNSAVEHSLTYIDHHGGSSPLILVIRTATGEKLDTEESYHQLWELQLALEKYKEVGSIISLPVMMAQAKQSFLASLLPWNSLLDILQGRQFNGIARSFITDDHREGLFLLRMNESNRKIPRLKVIEEIRNIVSAHGFILEKTGGIYNLQGHLANLVASSIIFGLGQLILIFTLIAWIISRSIKIAFAITLSICVIPVIVLGVVGWLRIPLDIISAPASNIALGLGIDSMIHMVRAYKRLNHRNNQDAKAWSNIRHRFWQPVLTFTLVMILGFGIFMFSEFPSTQRFGAAVVFGALIASMTALFVMPTTAQANIKIKMPH
jgi:predicted RND superfamily exporter protein